MGPRRRDPRAWDGPHGEALTISDHLTVWREDGNPEYRPTVHYAYHPSDAAINSVLELRMRNWEMQSRQRILNDEITSGADELGVLLMGHPYRSWWTGSLLSIAQARAILPHQSATTLQVAGSIIAAVSWMIGHQNGALRARRPPGEVECRRTWARCTRLQRTGIRCRLATICFLVTSDADGLDRDTRGSSTLRVVWHD
jgi:hypothetical protein